MHYRHYTKDSIPCFVYLMTTVNFHINNSMCYAAFQIIGCSICSIMWRWILLVIFVTEIIWNIQRHERLFLKFCKILCFNLMYMFQRKHYIYWIYKFHRTQCFCSTYKLQRTLFLFNIELMGNTQFLLNTYDP